MVSDSDPRRRSRPVRENMRDFGVWAFESHHDDRFRMGPTTHRFPKLLLIREGVGKIQFESYELSCKAGDLLVVAAGERHWLVDQPVGRCRYWALGCRPSCWLRCLA